MSKDNRYSFNAKRHGRTDTKNNGEYYYGNKVRVPRKGASKYVWRNFFKMFPDYDHHNNPHKGKTDREKLSMHFKAFGKTRKGELWTHYKPYNSVYRAKHKTPRYHMFSKSSGWTPAHCLVAGDKFYVMYGGGVELTVLRKTRKGNLVAECKFSGERTIESQTMVKPLK